MTTQEFIARCRARDLQASVQVERKATILHPAGGAEPRAIVEYEVVVDVSRAEDAWGSRIGWRDRATCSDVEGIGAMLDRCWSDIERSQVL